MRICVVGAGFSGAVIARNLSEAGFQVLVIDEGFDGLARQQDRVRGIASRQATVTPDGHETAIAAFRRPRKPLGILAPFAVSIDECA